jgi:hypothetical protein
MTQLTAQEAREIALNKGYEKNLNTILQRIQEEAQEGRFELTVREFGFGDSQLYSCKEEAMPLLNRSILNSLRGLGYNACICTEEYQFVDIYLKVTW